MGALLLLACWAPAVSWQPTALHPSIRLPAACEAAGARCDPFPRWCATRDGLAAETYRHAWLEAGCEVTR